MSNVFQYPLSSTLARRLAEAADGFRNVNQVFFIAGYKFPHAIKDFPDLASAEAYFDEKGFKEKDYAIYGPYKTTDEVEDLDLAGVENIKKVDLTIHFKNGDHQNITLQGSVDSIFLNLSSFDKFVFPYYCHLYGAKYAKKMRDNLIALYNETPVVQNKKALPKPPPHAPLTLILPLIQGEELP